MPEPTHAEQMVAKYEALNLQCAGMISMNVDGQQVSLEDIKAGLAYWERKVAIQNASRPRLRRIVLG